MTNFSDISGLLVSMNELTGKLNTFFTDSVILTMDFKIEALGSDLEELMQFRSDELVGQYFDSYCLDSGCKLKLEEHLNQGYFINAPAHLMTKGGEPVKVFLSGFYLGLISEINGYIILKIKLIEDSSFLKKELFTKKRELDLFIYRTAHDLRGPLATIKGLVNLLKLRQDNNEVDELTSLIEVHANKLDDRLFKLLYLANSNSISEDCKGSLNFNILKAKLEHILVDNFQLDKALFLFTAPKEDLVGVNENIVYQMISNIFLYIISLPITSIKRESDITLHVDFVVRSNWLNVTIKADGFLTSSKIRDAIHNPTSLYSDLLSYPFLFNYYVAQKEVMQLHALFRIDFTGEGLQIIQISIPLTFEMQDNGLREILPAT